MLGNSYKATTMLAPNEYGTQGATGPSTWSTQSDPTIATANLQALHTLRVSPSLLQCKKEGGTIWYNTIFFK